MSPIYRVFALLVLVIVTMACGAADPPPITDDRTTTIVAQLEMADAARDEFVTWDDQRRAALAGDELAQYMARRMVVTDALESSYRALAVAATQDDELSLEDAEIATSTLVERVSKFTAGP